MGFPLRQGNVLMLIQENVHRRGQLDQLNYELIPSALRFVWLAAGV